MMPSFLPSRLSPSQFGQIKGMLKSTAMKYKKNNKLGSSENIFAMFIFLKENIITRGG